ncbi:UNVERIFIED_CONTAM: hypothetical protein FKN15_075538 [Acipenser sinensis]
MSTLGFDSYVEPLKLYLQKFREAMKGEKGIVTSVTVADGLGDELTDESFTNQLPAGLITADGQQQNVMVYTTSYQQVKIFKHSVTGIWSDLLKITLNCNDVETFAGNAVNMKLHTVCNQI